MSFINMNMGGDIAEPKPVPEGRYDLTISEATHRNSEGKNDIEVILGIDGHDDAPSVRHYISLKPQEDPKKANFSRLMLKRFLVQFGIPHSESGFDVNDFPGAKANCQLGIETNDKNQTFNRLNLDRLPDAEAAAAGLSQDRSPPKGKKRG